MTLPKRTWQRGDLLLAAAGSLACVQALYLCAAEPGKLHQSLPCPLTKADYVVGQAVGHLAVGSRKAARCPSVGGVMPYASCTEVLTQYDLEQVAKQAGLLVRILLRGPLVARTRNAMVELKQILSTLPPPVGKIPRGSAPPSVLPSNFNGVASLLQSWDAYPFLLTAGGCTGCLILGDDAIAGLYLEYSRFDGLELAVGCEAAAVNGTARGFTCSGRVSCGLMGSVVPELLGMDYTGIQESLIEWGVPVLRFPCTGFEFAPMGVDRILRNLAAWRRPEGRDNQRISTLDYSDLALGSRQPLRLGAEALTAWGYQVCVWGEEGFGGGELRSALILNWMVTAEGLGAARQMEADYGIPYFCGLPLERYGLERWLSRFSTVAKGAPSEKPVEHETGNRTLLLIEVPIATEGLAWAIRGEYPNCWILRAFYVPYWTLKELHRPFLIADALLSDDPAKPAAWATSDVLLADPLFFPSLRSWSPRAELLACLEPGVCGRSGLPARWPEDVARVMSAIGKGHTWQQKNALLPVVAGQRSTCYAAITKFNRRDIGVFHGNR